MISNPSTFDFHSPGTGGDVTPGPFSSTVLIANAANASAQVIMTGHVDFPTLLPAIYLGVTPGSTNYAMIGNPGSGQTQINGTTEIYFSTGGNQKVHLVATKFEVMSGVIFQLGNAAATGLVAGALAALTTSSIVIYDSTGTAYRVPCITP